MQDPIGQISFILLAATVLASAGAVVLVWRYRAAMRRLTSAAVGAAGVRVHADAALAAEAGAAPPSDPTGARLVSEAENRRAGLRIAGLLVVLSALIALSAAALFLGLVMGAELFSAKRLAVLALAQGWPVVPALAFLWRWSRTRLLAMLFAWCALCFGVMLWRSIEPRPLEVLQYLAIDIGPPLVLIGLLCLGRSTRAVGLWLLPPAIVLVSASVFGLELLRLLVAYRIEWLMALPAWLDARVVMAAFVLAPWLLAWWPLRRLGRLLGRWYAHKHLSELLVQFSALWAASLAYQALGAAHDLGGAALVMLAPLLWVPLGVRVFQRLVPVRGAVPTLLVLRVFQRDAQVEALYDHVIERWRLSGNTVLIAGTDLAGRTTDADDIFTFLDGGLAQRFIRDAADVAPRLAAFDLQTDADARYRVNECYCHDRSWQPALAALVRASDLVLMDLRGFAAHNAGCRFELATLARPAGTARLRRVVVLVDAATDRTTVAADITDAPAGRFVQIDAERMDGPTRRAVLRALLAGSAGREGGAS